MSSVSRLVLVTGHVFGIRAFEGIFSSNAYVEGRLEVPMMIGLGEGYAGSTVGYRSVGGLAREQGVRHVLTSDGRLGSLANLIGECRPNYILIVGWSRLVLPAVLHIPTMLQPSDTGSAGCIGMHPTKLPVGRGQAPIPWTIIKGLRETALSVFFLEAAADTGALIAQYGLDLNSRETAASLFYKFANLHFVAGSLLAEGLAQKLVMARQQDASLATVWPKRRPADGEIRDDMTVRQVDALVRALLGPYPRAFIVVDGDKIGIRKVEYVGVGDSVEHRRHTLAVYDDRVRFSCADGVVDLYIERI